jgi:glutamate racemase
MIGVFDSGLGGLTVLSSLLAALPGYDYVYLGDNARAPYGMRSLDTVYEFTREAVTFLFELGCPLVILACNTASARALRTLQQRDLPAAFPDRRVLGVVRPSVEALAGLPPGAVPGVTAPALAEGTVAVVGTPGTITSDSYRLELAKLAPRLRLVQRACPIWVSLVECGELEGEGTRHFLRKELEPLFAGDPAAAPSRLLLGCTHYPLLLPEIRKLVPRGVEVLAQGEIVAARLADWLARHPEMESRLGKHGRRRFLTTDDPLWFSAQGAPILGQSFQAQKARLHAV